MGVNVLYLLTPSKKFKDMKPKKTVWSIFRDLVNSRPIGAEITRQEIIANAEISLLVDENDLEKEDCRLSKFSPVTIDCNRNMATQLGYLAKTDKAGIYRVRKHFAPDYTVSQLRKDYDNGNYC